jgi:hypothetical protein
MLRVDPEPLGGPFDRLTVLGNAKGLAAKQGFALPKGQEIRGGGQARDQEEKEPHLIVLSFRRKPESSGFREFWTPVFTGVTA